MKLVAARSGSVRGVAWTTRLAAAAAALLAALTAGRAEAAYVAELDGPSVQIFGDKASDTLVLRASADLTHLEGDVGNDGTPEFSFDLAQFNQIYVSAGAGNDVVQMDETLLAFTTSKTTTVDGGPGNDQLIGGQGAETLLGGAGDDVVDGGGGSDVAMLGDGDDVFVWNPGDGSDTIEGGDGDDRIAFQGSAAAESFDVAANGGRVHLFRDVGSVTLDADDVEQLDLAAGPGTDTALVNDLTGTDLVRVNVDPAFGPGSVTDTQQDSVVVLGTPGPDTVDVGVDDENGLALEGLAATVRVIHMELLFDRLAFTGIGNDRVNVNGTKEDDDMAIVPSPVAGAVRVTAYAFAGPVDVSGAAVVAVNGLGGADTIACTGNLAALAIPLELHGGKGDDAITGSNGADLLFGERGRDLVDGAQGNDVAFLGPGADTFVWDPGDGSDTIEGESGADLLAFNGSNASEQITLSPNGQRLQLFRDIGNVTMDANGVEQVVYQALGGADTVVVNDLTGTTVKAVAVDLENPPGSELGDAQPDAVVVNGTPLPDKIRVSASSAGVLVKRKRGAVRIEHAEPVLDTLTVNGLGSVDKIAASPDVASAIGLTINPD